MSIADIFRCRTIEQLLISKLINQRISKDVSYADINLTVLPNGVAVLATDTEVEVFKDDNVKVIDQPPFNSNTKLFNVSGGICYLDGKRVFSAKMKK